MERKDARIGKDLAIRTVAQDGEKTQDKPLRSNGEDASRSVAPGRFRVVAATDGGAPGDSTEGAGNEIAEEDAKNGRSESARVSLEFAEIAEIAEADEGDEGAGFDEFSDENAFFASFSADDETRRAANSFDAAFAGGLRSLFDAESEEDERAEEAEDEEATDAERFQRDFDRERRESLDGVLLQNDADFLREAGEKYERSRVSDADFERRSGARSCVGGVLDGRNDGRGRQNGGNGDDRKDEGGDENGKNGENGARGESAASAPNAPPVARRVPIGPASILEAMLFVGDRENRPLTLARATELMRNVSETEAIEALADLNERYWRDGAPYRIVRDGDGFRMALRSEFDALAARLVGGKTKEFKLTQTMIDVLALIAYRQPISLDEILETRNNATGALSQLVKRELVAQEKRVVDKKKVAFYSTTPRFLRLFNLESLDDLPIVGDVDYR
ncbi:MAG: SMC-Scp complex subunit ScpB [Thermoguttaceae bacterium]|nr:SMC-Scp complex subunit ScpB [Thermoguttaceae bacterium]